MKNKYLLIFIVCAFVLFTVVLIVFLTPVKNYFPSLKANINYDNRSSYILESYIFASNLDTDARWSTTIIQPIITDIKQNADGIYMIGAIKNKSNVTQYQNIMLISKREDIKSVLKNVVIYRDWNAKEIGKFSKLSELSNKTDLENLFVVDKQVSVSILANFPEKSFRSEAYCEQLKLDRGYNLCGKGEIIEKYAPGIRLVPDYAYITGKSEYIIPEFIILESKNYNGN